MRAYCQGCSPGQVRGRIQALRILQTGSEGGRRHDTEPRAGPDLSGTKAAKRDLEPWPSRQGAMQ